MIKKKEKGRVVICNGKYTNLICPNFYDFSTYFHDEIFGLVVFR